MTLKRKMKAIRGDIWVNQQGLREYALLLSIFLFTTLLMPITLHCFSIGFDPKTLINGEELTNPRHIREAFKVYFKY